MPDTRDSREILERLSQLDVRQQGGQHGIKTVTRQPRLRRSVEAARPWTFVDVIVIALTLLVAGVVSSLILGNWLTNLLPAVGVVWVRITLLVVFYLIELGVLALLAYRRKLSFAAAFRLRRLTDDEQMATEESESVTSGRQASADPATRVIGDARERSARSRHRAQSAHPFSTIQAIVIVIVTSILLRLAVYGWTLLATTTLHWSVPKAESMPYLFGSTWAGAIAAVGTVALLGPFIEELAFRVIIQEWFAVRLPILLTALITSAIFAGSHFSLWALPLNLLLGFATAWLAYKSKTIWPAVALHALYNATVVLAAFYLLLK